LRFQPIFRAFYPHFSNSTAHFQSFFSPAAAAILCHRLLNSASPLAEWLPSFSKTTAVVFKNHCGRFQKPLRSFSEITAVEM